MKYVKGDIWNLAQDNSWIIIPTNTTIRRDGKAVMGAGMAKEAADRYPELPIKLAKHINRFHDRLYIDKPLICLPTKHYWRQKSELDLIRHGCYELLDLARILKSVGDTTPILLPKLGCGLGGLNWERVVRPVIDSLLEEDRFILVQHND